MAVLIIVLAFSLLFAFLATQNTFPVTLRAGVYVFPGIPIYMIVLGSLLLGIVVAWFLSLFGWIGSALTIFHKEKTLLSQNQDIKRLEEKVHDLEIENSRLKGEDSSKTLETPGGAKSPLLERFRNLGNV